MSNERNNFSGYIHSYIHSFAVATLAFTTSWPLTDPIMCLDGGRGGGAFPNVRPVGSTYRSRYESPSGQNNFFSTSFPLSYCRHLFNFKGTKRRGEECPREEGMGKARWLFCVFVWEKVNDPDFLPICSKISNISLTTTGIMVTIIIYNLHPEWIRKISDGA